MHGIHSALVPEEVYNEGLRCTTGQFGSQYTIILKRFDSNIQGSPQCRKCRLPDRMNSKKKKYIFIYFFPVSFCGVLPFALKDG